MKRREDYGSSAEAFFAALDAPVAPLARALREVIRAAVPGATESIKWGMPVYEQDKLICAIRPARDYVALQFYADGVTLTDPDGLLEGTGARMRHVKIRSAQDIKKTLFTSWLEQVARAARA